ASVKIHQVLKVGYGPTVHSHSETVTWAAGLSGEPRPRPYVGIQSTLRRRVSNTASEKSAMD
ncbi:hypothetical protein M9458_036890, partial [Cirrhinus mrigala]